MPGHDLPHPDDDRETLLAWLRERSAKAPGHPPVRTVEEFQAAQMERLRRKLGGGGKESTTPREDTPEEWRERVYARPAARAHALAESWAEDPTPVTRAEAARLLFEVLDPRGWVETDRPA